MLIDPLTQPTIRQMYDPSDSLRIADAYQQTDAGILVARRGARATMPTCHRP